jgi:purine-binding chemotaxis protein CheW
VTASKKPTPASTDWKKVRDRLAKSKAALETAQELSPERAQAILQERARVIARVPLEPPAPGTLLEVVTFALGTERYAIETSYVREVLRLKQYSPLPGTPDVLLGITTLRGQILAIMDLRSLFGLPSQADSGTSRIIVLGEQRIEFGMIADAVFEVTKLNVEDLREAPASVAGIAREFLRGVSADGLIVLSGTVLLNDSRLYIDVSEDGGQSARR